MSIPVWDYDQKYYAARLEPFHLEIRTDPIKGKGLFCKRSYQKGDRVLTESALCCTQNLDDANRGIPVCGNCLVSLETPNDIVKRCFGRQIAATLPVVECYRARVTPVPCTQAEVTIRAGATPCTAQYCSVRCRDTHWNHSHHALCSGRMSVDQTAALAAFMGHSWTHGGIDLSDTHFLALKFIALAVTRHRLHGFPLSAAYAPVAQLIYSPIRKFAFTYLLREDYEEANGITYPNDAAAAAARFEHFLQNKHDSLNDPVVKHARKDVTRGVDEVLEEAADLIRRIFDFNTEEAGFFTAERWSNLLGAVLLNGQERSPNSPYTEYGWVARKSQFAGSFRNFVAGVKAAGKDASKLDGSTRGQGVYMIGACFNHSCQPNVQVSYVDDNDETLVAVAMRDVAEGEELFISYIDEDAPLATRQQQLFEHYLFDCACSKCSRELALANQPPQQEVAATED